ELSDRMRTGRHRMTRLGTVPLGQEAFQGANGDRPVDFASPACCLTRVGADAPADACHRIWIARITVRLFEAALGNQRYISSCVGVRRTSHHAREIGIQPLPIDLLVGKTK